MFDRKDMFDMIGGMLIAILYVVVFIAIMVGLLVGGCTVFVSTKGCQYLEYKRLENETGQP